MYVTVVQGAQAGRDRGSIWLGLKGVLLVATKRGFVPVLVERPGQRLFVKWNCVSGW